MPTRDRLIALIRSLPPAQRAGIAVAAMVLVMAAIPFFQWITTPSYTLLYSGMDDRQLAEVTDQLDSDGVVYQLDGARVMVPRDDLHRIRASLAQAGVAATPAVTGYELLDDQALGVSDFRQRVDLQRAWEGELTRTLLAMDAIDSASVRLVIPETTLFAEQPAPATASVLIGTRGTLEAGQIEAITLLVSSAVDGLDPADVTIADTRGQVLHSPGDGTTGGFADRHQRHTREFEAALAADLTQLLNRATNAPASAVVRARLDFDETETQREQFDGEGVPLREHTLSERSEGSTPAAGGVIGVDGGPLADATEGTHEREEATREFGVGRTTTRTVQAPGTVEQLNVAVVVDETSTLSDAELQALIAAASGYDAGRGDQIAITRVATPPAPDVLPAEAGWDVVELAQRIVALVVLVAIAVGLLLMLRRRFDRPAERVVEAHVQSPWELQGQREEQGREEHRAIRQEVSELVERQPEEIASLLRSWLADRKPPS